MGGAVVRMACVPPFLPPPPPLHTVLAEGGTVLFDGCCVPHVCSAFRGKDGAGVGKGCEPSRAAGSRAATSRPMVVWGLVVTGTIVGATRWDKHWFDPIKIWLNRIKM
ncbi:hypothetical protein DFH07DRAFT_780242 [Mycena maculata]|uniref:Uncharacterized protein n=1 Tax=Mycena maculata TaxID=230809 RepID=A0AAD7I5F0_9AGAR|nr:hypothetical protein DFH07DRAFT_780242 [Mycena maculata]